MEILQEASNTKFSHNESEMYTAKQTIKDLLQGDYIIVEKL